MARPEPLVFDHMADLDGLRHGVFTRRSGVSLPPFEGLNIGLGCGDNPEHVRENRKRMLTALGLDRGLFLSQVHGDRIHVIRRGRVNPAEFWDWETGRTPAPVAADGVVTDVPELGLVIQIADCQAVILYDPVKRVVANVHAGWRGSTLDILGKCVDRMVGEFDCAPPNILAGISPSLGPCCAEFVNFESELPESFRIYKDRVRPHFDFWRISKAQLSARGVLLSHIRHIPLCTVCHPDLFFSYRGEKTTGRFAAVAALVNP